MMLCFKGPGASEGAAGRAIEDSDDDLLAEFVEGRTVLEAGDGEAGSSAVPHEDLGLDEDCFEVASMPITATDLSRALIEGSSTTGFFPSYARFTRAVQRIRRVSQTGPIVQMLWTSFAVKNLAQEIVVANWRCFPELSKSRFVRSPLRWALLTPERRENVEPAAAVSRPSRDGMSRPAESWLLSVVLSSTFRRSSPASRRTLEIVSSLPVADRSRPCLVLLAHVQGIFDIEGKGLLGSFLCGCCAAFLRLR